MNKPKFKFRRLVLLFLMIGTAFSLMALSQNVAKLFYLKSEHQQAAKEKESIEALNADLTKEITNLDNPEYIARIARSEYRFTLPGEHIVLFSEE